ncbi:hypothetical protein PM082_013998 [Marasmius tenuissimus]|nr:hypothetical protein PM082_013998 [Marasmius tenuissimus]
MGITTLTVKAVVFNDPILQTKPKVQRWIFAGFHLIGGGIASIILVALPFYAFWNSSSLRVAERRLILVLFASTILNLGTVCARAAFTINRGNGRGLSYAINTQIAVSVIVCNSLVVITTLFRWLFWRKRTTTEGASDEPDEEYYNSGERVIDLGRTRDATHTQTWGLTLTTIDSSTHNVGESESRFTELEELQERTYALRSCG